MPQILAKAKIQTLKTLVYMKVMFKNDLTIRRVDAQVDWHGRYALVGAGDAVGLRLNLAANLVEVHELLALAVEKLRVFYI